MSGTSTRSTLWARLRRLFGLTGSRKPDEDADAHQAEVPGAGPLHPDTMDLSPDCPTCHGARVVVVPGPEGGKTIAPCPECAPNDALGG